MFAGSIPQALMLMNGEIVSKAVSADSGSYLNAVLNDTRLRNENLKIQRLYVSTLAACRPQGARPVGPVRKIASESLAGAYQDLYWALLNSNEFVVNH